MTKRHIKESEHDIQKAILDYLTLLHIFAWRANTGAMRISGNGKDRFVRFGMPGCADIIGIIPMSLPAGDYAPFKTHGRCESDIGCFLAIEVKSATGKLSAAQKSFRDAVRANGGLYILARSVADVQKILEAK